jgi:hypothetical protein
VSQHLSSYSSATSDLSASCSGGGFHLPVCIANFDLSVSSNGDLIHFNSNVTFSTFPVNANGNL